MRGYIVEANGTHIDAFAERTQISWFHCIVTF